MNSDVKISLIWATCIVFVVGTIAGSLTYYNVKVMQFSMENGYEQTTVPGTNNFYWVKTKDKIPQ